MTEKPSSNPANRAEDFSHRWRDKLEECVALRMEEFGFPDNKLGEPEHDADGRWPVFKPFGRNGSGIVTGVVVDSGVLNTDLLKGKKGGRIRPKARLRDRIDETIAHEWEESRHGTNVEALKAAATTDLPISKEARRICRAMAR